MGYYNFEWNWRKSSVGFFDFLEKKKKIVEQILQLIIDQQKNLSFSAQG